MAMIDQNALDDYELLSILRQGVDVWNDWREQNPWVAINLTVADLRKTELSGANLKHANLNDATLKHAVLTKANLAGANLAGANLKHADLREANLARANLAGANLKHADLLGANLEGVNLERANLRDASLSHAILKGANLEESNLHRADVSSANLEGATLKRASLWEARLSKVHLKGADLEAANLAGAELAFSNLEAADLEGANLWGANLRQANLKGADLEVATLFDAKLEGSTLTHAIRYGTILESLNETISINIPDRDIDPEKERELEDAIDSYMTLLGYDREGVLEVKRGSLFKKIRYQISTFLTPEDKQEIYDTTKDVAIRSKSSFEAFLEKNGVENTGEMGNVTAKLLDSVKEIDNIVLLVGKLIIVKDSSKNQVFVTGISTEIQNELEANPQFLMNPEAVFDYFQQKRPGSPQRALTDTGGKVVAFEKTAAKEPVGLDVRNPQSESPAEEPSRPTLSPSQDDEELGGSGERKQGKKRGKKGAK